MRIQQKAAIENIASRQNQLRALDPEMVEVRLKRARKALEKTKAELAELQRQSERLRAEFAALDQQGLGEQAETLRAELLAAERRHAAIGRDANAVRVASHTLAEAAREAQQVFLKPVTERVQGYLRGLFPESQLLLDDEFRVVGIRRGSRDESFDCLNVGTREQLAAITRFAFADLPAEQGRDVPVILDDALVYSDDRRMDCMLNVIARAAERHQVIVLNRTGVLNMLNPLRRGIDI